MSMLVIGAVVALAVLGLLGLMVVRRRGKGGEAASGAADAALATRRRSIQSGLVAGTARPAEPDLDDMAAAAMDPGAASWDEQAERGDIGLTPWSGEAEQAADAPQPTADWSAPANPLDAPEPTATDWQAEPAAAEWQAQPAPSDWQPEPAGDAMGEASADEPAPWGADRQEPTDVDAPATWDQPPVDDPAIEAERLADETPWTDPVAGEPQPAPGIGGWDEGADPAPADPVAPADGLGGPPEPTVMPWGEPEAGEPVDTATGTVESNDFGAVPFATDAPADDGQAEPYADTSAAMPFGLGAGTEGAAPGTADGDEAAALGHHDGDEAQPDAPVPAWGVADAAMPAPASLRDDGLYAAPDGADAAEPGDEDGEPVDGADDGDEGGSLADWSIPRGQVDFDALDAERAALGDGDAEIAPVEEAWAPEPMAPLADAPAADPYAPLSPALGGAMGDDGADAGPLVRTKKNPKRSTAGLTPEGMAAAASAPSSVEETVSLILRRQVPAGDAATARSWLGGLPMMPDHVEWPRASEPEKLDEGDKPLNFVAQIACEDFPEDLWGGLGPRSGWLLFFLNGRDGIGDDNRLFKVIHIDELGAERAAPDDLPPVFDEIYAGPDFRHVRSAEDIPGTWRKWPVELVAVPNQAFNDNGRVVVAGRDIAHKLYPGEAIEADPAMAGGDGPFSWRGALYVVDSILRQGLEASPPPALNARLKDTLLADGYMAAMVPSLRAEERDWHENGLGKELQEDEPLRERDKVRRAEIQGIADDKARTIEALAHFIAQSGNAAALAERIDAEAQAYGEWLRAIPARVGPVREAILTNPLDSALDPADWEALKAHLGNDRIAWWSAGWNDEPGGMPVAITRHETTLLDLARPGIEAAVVEVAADYAADPARAALVPGHLLSRLEPHWRHIDDARPHRIGGFHDGIQSEPEPGEQSEVLLLQLASDSAMHWQWGDGGAYYIFIEPRDLAAGAYDNANIRLENY